MPADPRIEELRRKLQENPRRFFAPLANELRQAGAAAEAVALCRAHLPQHPEHLSGFIVYGQALFDLGELTEARAVFEQALGVDPENLVALRYLGDIAKRRGDASAARRWYERVLEADPRNDAVASQLDALAPARPEPLPFRPPRERAEAPVANVSAARPGPAATAAVNTTGARGDVGDAGAVATESDAAGRILLPDADDPFGFPSAPTETEPEMLFVEGLAAPVVWPDTADLVARRLTPRALPVFPMPADDETIAAFGREAQDPPGGTPALPAPVDPVVVDPAPVALPAVASASISPASLAPGAIDPQLAERPPVEPGGAGSDVAPLPSEPVATAESRPAAFDDGDVAIDWIFGGGASSRTDGRGLQAVPTDGDDNASPLTGKADARVAGSGDLALPRLHHDPAFPEDEGRDPVAPPSAFYTETMAELLLAQGYAGRALEVYEALVAQRPDDAPLRDRLEAARQRASSGHMVGAPAEGPSAGAAAGPVQIAPPPPRPLPPSPTTAPPPPPAWGSVSWSPVTPPAPVSLPTPTAPLLTARERLARLAHAAPGGAPGATGGAASPGRWPVELPPHEPLFTGPGRAADERVARQWVHALQPASIGADSAPDAFDQLWELTSVPDEDLSLEHTFAVRTPVRPAPAVRPPDGGRP